LLKSKFNNLFIYTNVELIGFSFESFKNLRKMSGKLMGKKRKLKEQEKLFEKAEEKKSKKQVGLKNTILK
jgi:hypothetical protein